MVVFSRNGGITDHPRSSMIYIYIIQPSSYIKLYPRYIYIYQCINDHFSVSHILNQPWHHGDHWGWIPISCQAVSVKGRVGLALDFDLTKTPAHLGRIFWRGHRFFSEFLFVLLGMTILILMSGPSKQLDNIYIYTHVCVCTYVYIYI